MVLRAYARSGWFADLRGAPEDAEGGGLVSDLPTLSFSTDRPGVAVQPPVEIRLTSTQERTISELGLIPIVPLPYTPYLVFNTNSSLHQPPAYDRPSATQNARLSAMLQYVLCGFRQCDMSQIERSRRDAAKCLRMAKSAQNPDEKQSWLALAESWLTTVQLQSGDELFQVTERKKAKAVAWAAQSAG